MVMDRITVMTENYRAARVRLGFLDVNLWLGRPRSPEFASGFDLSTLQGRLARYGIQGGVVSHLMTISYSPALGNEQLLNALEGTGLWAGITLVPEVFEDEQAGCRYLDNVITKGARLARLFPKTHNFSLRSWCASALLRALADRRLPLAIWHTETSWEEIRALCEAYSELPVIVEGTPQKILYYNRIFYPLLAQCANLRLELHNLVNYLGLEDIVARFGAQRLLFGSFMPIYDPNATLMQVTHARISEEDKALIARQNLEELVAGVQKI